MNPIGTLNDRASLLGARDHTEHLLLRQGSNRGIEIRRLVESLELVLVGEQDIDGPIPHQAKKFVPIPVDAEGIRKGQGDLVSGGVGNLGSPHESFFRCGRIPKVAFEVDDTAVPHERLVDIVRGQLLAGAEEGVHGALAVGRDENVAARGRRAVLRMRRFEVHADRPDVMGEGTSGLVILDLADEGGTDTEGRETDDRIGGRPAADHRGRSHVGVKLLGARLVDEHHGALVQVLTGQKVIVSTGDQIDNRIANPKDVETAFAHANVSLTAKAGKSLGHRTGSVVKVVRSRPDRQLRIRSARRSRT